MRRLAAITAVLTASLGCGGSEVAEFPAGWEMLAPVALEVPESAGAVSDVFETDDWVEGHSAWRIDRPVVDVWAALRNPDVGVDRRRVDEWTSVTLDDGTTDFAMAVTNSTTEIITVSFDLTWRHKVVEGGPSSPEQLAVRWQKTFGPDIIERLEGSMVVWAVSDESTGVQVVERLATPTSSPDELDVYLRDFFNDTEDAAWGRGLTEF